MVPGKSTYVERAIDEPSGSSGSLKETPCWPNWAVSPFYNRVWTKSRLLQCCIKAAALAYQFMWWSKGNLHLVVPRPLLWLVLSKKKCYFCHWKLTTSKSLSQDKEPNKFWVRCIKLGGRVSWLDLFVCLVILGWFKGYLALILRPCQ